MRLTDDEVAEIWVRYVETRDPVLLDTLVRQYEPLARYYARRSLAKAPAHQDLEDLLSSAHQGLLEAVRRFEPERGLKFETFASRRIAGAIVDGQRRDDPLTRAARQQVNGLRDAQRSFWEKHGRSASIEDLAAVLDVSATEVRSLLVQQQTLTRELDEAIESPTFGEPEYDAVHLDELAGPAREQLALRIAALSDRDRTFILLYYVRGQTLRELGHYLGCSDSRCAQIRKEIIRGLSHIS